jgi:hypothetical protein
VPTKGIHTALGGRSRLHLYLHMERYTIVRLRHIVLLVYDPSCRISITICLQTKAYTETAMHHVITHLEGAVENRKLNFSYPGY